jgi:Zn-finger nucleic acid-binding protein
MIEPGLTCQHCDACGGSWVAMNDYMTWHQQQDATVNVSRTQEETDIEDSSAVLICPNCNQIMGKFRVDPKVDHRIDQCGNCGGFWLDKGEWESLRRLNLHARINTIFTDSWQRKVREQSHKRNAEKRYIKKFGLATYQQAKELRESLIANPFKSRVIAYLMNPEPKVPSHAQPLNQSYCPKCSKLMARYKLADDSEIYIEQCDACGGIWVNSEQWRDIVRKSFALTDIFAVQKERDADRKIPYVDQYFEATFGKNLYRQVKAFKPVLLNHERKLELISYLSKEEE